MEAHNTAEEGSWITSNIVKVIVGASDNAREFAVHEDLITEKSQFFKHMLDPEEMDLVEPKQGTFPEHDADVFAMYLRHIYRYPIKQNGDSDSAYDAHFTNIAKTYVLANMLMDHGTKADMLEEMRRLGSNGRLIAPRIAAVNTVYAGTMEYDPARDLMVSLFTDHGDFPYAEEIIDEVTENLNPTFMHDLIKDLLWNRLPTKVVKQQREDLEEARDKAIHDRHKQSDYSAQLQSKLDAQNAHIFNLTQELNAAYAAMEVQPR